MERLSFIKQYLLKPRFVGAVLPSSKYLAAKMIEDIDFNSAKCIVEYGPGTGVFTEMLIKNRRPDTLVLLFECNEDFYRILIEKYKNQSDLIIINNSAEHLDKYLAKYDIPWVDYIVSGLPFASLPENVSSAILEKTQKYLKKGGRFITFQYTLLKKSLIKKHFSGITIKREIRNIPPAYIFSCSH